MTVSCAHMEVDLLLEFIKNNLPKEEILAQLAEESTELAHAALKLRRAIDGKNPTPVSEKQAWANLAEEVIDVSLCLGVLGLCKVNPEGDPLYYRKLERWANRLQNMGFDPDSMMGEYEEENE